MNNKDSLSRKQEYSIFAVAGIAVLMNGIDATIVTVGLPAMMKDFHTSVALIGWTLMGYVLAQAIIMPILGKLSDDLGRRKMFLGATLIFTASSVAVALSPDIIWAIIFRLLQGLGGGAFLPLATGIVSDTFGERRMTAIGLFSSIFNSGGLIGPNVGGFLIDNFSWHWIFLINLPIGIALYLWGLKVLPRDKPRATFSYQQIDLPGMALFIVGTLSLLYGMTNWAANPSTPGLITLGLFAAAIIIFIFFIRREDKVPNPTIETKLLRWRPFLAVNLYNFIFGATLLGSGAFVPYYTTVAYNMTASQSGLVITPRSFAVVIASAVTSFLIVRLRYRKPMLFGLIVMAAGTMFLGVNYAGINPLGLNAMDNLVLILSILSLVSGIGFGMANPAVNNAVLDLVPEKTAAVAGIRGMFRFMGGVIATAVITLVLSAIPDQGYGMRLIFIIFGLLLLLLIPVVFMIPDMADGKSRENKPR